MGEESQLAEAWDWRQRYAQYSDLAEPQALQHAAPEAPEAVAADDPSLPLYRGGRGFSIAAFVCGGAALLLFPFILGPLGVIFGFVANAKGDRIGKWAGLMSIATTVLGIALSIWVAGNPGLHFGA